MHSHQTSTIIRLKANVLKSDTQPLYINCTRIQKQKTPDKALIADDKESAISVIYIRIIWIIIRDNLISFLNRAVFRLKILSKKLQFYKT